MYSAYDYLCDEPFYIENMGHVKCPTLRDIRKITYDLFTVYINTISMSLDTYLDICGLREGYDKLSDKEKEDTTLYNLLLFGNKEVLIGILDLFLTDTYNFDNTNNTFIIYEDSNEIGHIGNDNFDLFREEMKCILGINAREEKPRFKNALAEKMYNRMQKHAEKQKKQENQNCEFDNMIKKYCTHNKVGINILNVWDMTYYQFTTMFAEYCNARQCDYNDMMAANTFSFKKSTDYKPMAYLKPLK